MLGGEQGWGQEMLGIVLTTENTKVFGEGPRLGEKVDAKILNPPSKGDRSNTCQQMNVSNSPTTEY